MVMFFKSWPLEELWCMQPALGHRTYSPPSRVDKVTLPGPYGQGNER